MNIKVLMANFVNFMFQERSDLESVFPMNYSRHYVRGHETQYLDQIAVILVSNSKNGIGFSKLNGLFKLGRKIEAEVTKMRVNTIEHGPISFADVCAKSRSSLGQDCQMNNILRLKDEVRFIFTKTPL